MKPQLDWVNVMVWGSMAGMTVAFWGYLGWRSVALIAMGLPR